MKNENILKINELIPYKKYTFINNKFDHIKYFIDDNRILWTDDLIVKCQFKNTMEYNEVIKLEFYES